MPSRSHSTRTGTYAQSLHNDVVDACAAAHRESEQTNRPRKKEKRKEMSPEHCKHELDFAVFLFSQMRRSPNAEEVFFF